MFRALSPRMYLLVIPSPLTHPQTASSPVPPYPPSSSSPLPHLYSLSIFPLPKDKCDLGFNSIMLYFLPLVSFLIFVPFFYYSFYCLLFLHDPSSNLNSEKYTCTHLSHLYIHLSSLAKITRKSQEDIYIHSAFK